MGPLGAPEMVFIFVLALLLFGPKKLPELGRTVGKAMNEFRRAQGELKATFSREMENLERESGIRELTATNYHSDSYTYDYSTYDSSYYDGQSYDSTVTNTTTAGASAIEGAGSAAPLQVEAAAGSIANGHLEAAHAQNGVAPIAHGQIEPAAAHPETPHAAQPEKPVNS